MEATSRLAGIMNQTDRMRLLEDARFFVGVARNERIDGFRAQAAECLRIAGNLRRYAVTGILKDVS
jgi:hypothetical protein